MRKSLPHDRAIISKSAPHNQTQCILWKIRWIIHRIIQNDHLQTIYKWIRICIVIPSHTNFHLHPSGQKNRFVARRRAGNVIRRGVDDGPERSINDLVKDRRVSGAINPTVEVSSADKVTRATEHGDIVAELASALRGAGEIPESGKSGKETRKGEVPSDSGGDESVVRQPGETVCGFSGSYGAAVDQ